MKHSEDTLARKLGKVRESAIAEITWDLEGAGGYGVEELERNCQSPIELLMLNALISSFWHRQVCDLGDMIGPSKYFPRLPAHEDHDPVGETNFIVAQNDIGTYRADFVVCRWVHDGPEQWLKTQLIVIECDGHDFHERTKEQAQRDKLRDREIQQAGYAVLRFTGSEVWRDAWGCAQQVNEFLSEKIRQEYSGR